MRTRRDQPRRDAKKTLSIEGSPTGNLQLWRDIVVAHGDAVGMKISSGHQTSRKAGDSEFPVELAIADGFGHVLGSEVLAALQVGDGPRHLADLVVGASAEA
jgi:hypothetical protein